MNNFNIYLTSVEPDIEQNIYSQSIGGYCSLSPLYYKCILNSNSVGLYEDTFEAIPNGDEFEDIWNNIEYISLNNEIMKVSSFDSHSGIFLIEERGHNGIIEMHTQNDEIKAISRSEIFNNVFDADHKQYRCFAVKNDGYSILNNVNVFLKQNSRNSNSNIRIAIELPRTKYLNSVSTSRGSLTFTDDTLIGEYEDNYFAECFLKPQNEYGGIVKSFDSETGTFVFYSSFSNVLDNKEYDLFPSPSFRLKSGIENPSGSYISDFVSSSSDSPLSIEDSVFYPNDLFYLWVEREVLDRSSSFENNDFVINISYEVTS